jgi:hypothetical protein
LLHFCERPADRRKGLGCADQQQLARMVLGLCGDAFTCVLSNLNFPTVASEGRPPAFVAGDFYFWWIENTSHYQSFQLLEEWRRREFTRKMSFLRTRRFAVNV